MDYETRITKVETLVDTIREELDRLHTDIADLRAQTDKNFKELREHVDQSFKELREHVDHSDRNLRIYIDHGLEVVRKEANTNLRWVVGLCLGNTALILGLYGKLFDLY